MIDTTYAAALSAFVTDDHVLSADLDARARALFLDFWAVTEAGAATHSVQTAAQSIAFSDSPRTPTTARVIGHDAWASPVDAALVNGISAHSLELDDTFEPASLHPAVVVFPAILALSEGRSIPWSRFAQAALVGYEVMCAVGLDAGAAETYARGFHPTGVSGVVGAAAAAARLAELSTAQTAHALGLAANMASGSLEFLSDGSWTKRLNAGYAASTAVRAVQLAAAGFTAPARAFEGRDGFFRQYATGTPDGRLPDLRFGRHAVATSIKFYPCCRYMHGAMDLLIEIRRELPALTGPDIVSIDVAVLDAGSALVSNPPLKKLDVRTSVDAQFSMPFGAALAITTGDARVSDFNDAGVLAAELLPVMRTVRCYTSAELEQSFPSRWGAEVAVTLVDGTTIEKRSTAFIGSATRPASTADIQDKARGLVGARRAEDMGGRLSVAADGQSGVEWNALIGADD